MLGSEQVFLFGGHNIFPVQDDLKNLFLYLFQLQSEGFEVPDRTDPRSLDLDSLSSCSLAGALPSQSSSSSSSESVVKSTDKNLDSVGVPHPCSSHSNDMSEGNRPLPLGLGLGGLQPKVI